MVNIDRSLHVCALVDDQVLNLVVSAVLPVRKRRDPCRFRLQRLCSLPLFDLTDQPCSTSLRDKVGVKDGGLRLDAHLFQVLDSVLSVSHTQLKMLFQRTHEKLCWQLCLLAKFLGCFARCKAFRHAMARSFSIFDCHVRAVHGLRLCFKGSILRRHLALRDDEEDSWVLTILSLLRDYLVWGV